MAGWDVFNGEDARGYELGVRRFRESGQLVDRVLDADAVAVRGAELAFFAGVQMLKRRGLACFEVLGDVCEVRAQFSGAGSDRCSAVVWDVERARGRAVAPGFGDAELSRSDDPRAATLCDEGFVSEFVDELWLLLLALFLRLLSFALLVCVCGAGLFARVVLFGFEALGDGDEFEGLRAIGVGAGDADQDVGGGGVWAADEAGGEGDFGESGESFG